MWEFLSPLLDTEAFIEEIFAEIDKLKRRPTDIDTLGDSAEGGRHSGSGDANIQRKTSERMNPEEEKKGEDDDYIYESDSPDDVHPRRVSEESNHQPPAHPVVPDPRPQQPPPPPAPKPLIDNGNAYRHF